ncbi:hypothetical protein VTP01DRAFT_5238 [Rhizomucor pusillus]|uniref:uncharacterized protein n=1 Tax=Rhizomucor pusillus TaxID=4840 RepID=UPI0037430CEF
MKISPLVFTILALFAVTSMASPIPWDKQEQRHQEQGKMEQIAGGSFNKGSIEGALNNVLEDGILNKHVTTTTIYQCSDPDGARSTTQAAGGSHNEGPVKGIGNNILQGGVLNYNVDSTKVYQINCKTGGDDARKESSA